MKKLIIKSLTEIKEDTIALRDSVVSTAANLKNSKLYKDSVQVGDALKDARDSFKKMDALDYHEFMELDLPSIYIDNYVIKISYRGNRMYVPNESVQKIKDTVNKFIDQIDFFRSVKLYKLINDPIDSSKKVFKIGELYSNVNGDLEDLTVQCNDEHVARIIREIFMERGYTYQKNDKNTLIKRIANTIKE